MSGLFLEKLRKTDIAGRWGGEEFLIICPETGLKGSIDLAEKIRKIISSNNFDIKSSVTVSAGCSEFTENENKNELIKRADNNLYKAKKLGKNRVVG